MANLESSPRLSFAPGNSSFLGKELPEDSPAFLRLSQTIREKLGRKPLPSFPGGHPDSIDGLMELAREAAAERWNESVGSIVEESRQEMAENLPRNEKQLKTDLTDPREIEDGLRHQRLTLFEGLKDTSLSDWLKLLVMNHHRQRTVFTILDHWLKSKQIPERTLQELEIRHAEIELMCQGVLGFGEALNLMYLNQTIFSSTDSEQTRPLVWDKDMPGAQLFFQLKGKDGKVRRFSYAEFFKPDWQHFLARLKGFRKEVERGTARGDLPTTPGNDYRALIPSLDQMLRTFSSKNKSPRRVSENFEDFWKETSDTYPHCRLQISGLSNWTNFYFDLELRLGYADETARGFSEAMESRRQAAQKIVDEYGDYIFGEETVPPIMASALIAQLGYPNATQEDTELYGISLYRNVIDSISRLYRIPLLRQIVEVTADEEEKIVAAIPRALVNHAFTHQGPPMENLDVAKRLALGRYVTETDRLDEMRAESAVSMLELMAQPSMTTEEKRIFILAQVAEHFYCIKYLGADLRYCIPAVAIIQLFSGEGRKQEGLFSLNGDGRHKLGNPDQGFSLLNTLSKKILNELYFSPNRPEEVQKAMLEFDQQILTSANDFQNSEIIKKIRGTRRRKD